MGFKFALQMTFYKHSVSGDFTFFPFFWQHADVCHLIISLLGSSSSLSFSHAAIFVRFVPLPGKPQLLSHIRLCHPPVAFVFVLFLYT